MRALLNNTEQNCFKYRQKRYNKIKTTATKREVYGFNYETDAISKIKLRLYNSVKFKLKIHFKSAFYRN